MEKNRLNVLVSVSDKRKLSAFAQQLAGFGARLLSTGGTARTLREAGVEVTDVATYTASPELMGGRLKTLHPKIHGGILARRAVDEAALAEHDIELIDMVVVNLYPFAQTIARPECTLAEAIENIDIGGPTMVRAAAKNHARVVVVVDPNDYERVFAALQQGEGRVDSSLRFELACKAFAHTADYDTRIAAYLGAKQTSSDILPATFAPLLELREQLRYGENPHQRAAFYVEASPAPGTIGAAEQIQGKALSYNNIADTDAALNCVWAFAAPACCIVKHANPCGVATACELNSAYARAYATDPTSAFGGIIAFNRPLDATTAASVIEQQFVEVIVAPEIEAVARDVLARRAKLRALQVGYYGEDRPSLDYKRVAGGVLVQDRDAVHCTLGEHDLELVTRRSLSAAERDDLLFAWRVVKCVKSNAIVYARDGQTIGIGAGQMSRVVSARIAALKAADAGLQVAGAVMASDAFLPFRDGMDAAAEVGIRAVIQPGGSQRDEEVIAAADEHGIAMAFTGMRHFRH